MRNAAHSNWLRERYAKPPFLEARVPRMIHWFTGPLKQIVSILVANDSTRQIGAGVALGMVIGLVPTGNLISFTLLFLLAALRVNRMAGLATTAAVAAVSPALDPFFHLLGVKILTISSFQSMYVSLYDAPLGAWVGFHNTVVIGSLLVGIYAAYPAYLIVNTIVDRIRPSFVKWILKYRLGRILLGVDISSRLGLSG